VGDDNEVRGLIAALPTPDSNGHPDFDALARIVDMVVAAGVDGVCMAGATGEYPRLDRSGRAAILRHTAARLPNDRILVAGIGSASSRASVELGQDAMDAGSRALLLPSPFFFHYAADDLEAFCLDVSDTLRSPCLLYNLPSFTTGFTTASMIRLLETGMFITGVKDSSGDRDRLPALAAARAGRHWTLLVGDDRLIHAGGQAGWDGAVSGIAACCPELLVALVRSVQREAWDDAARLQQLVDEIAVQLAVFPVPWGIRLALEARGYPTGALPLPMTAARRRQADAFVTWMKAFVDRLEL
jgi:4-hydroxy-tetrahydrodipicolinate synthase